MMVYTVVMASYHSNTARPSKMRMTIMTTHHTPVRRRKAKRSPLLNGNGHPRRFGYNRTVMRLPTRSKGVFTKKTAVL